MCTHCPSGQYQVFKSCKGQSLFYTWQSWYNSICCYFVLPTTTLSCGISQHWLERQIFIFVFCVTDLFWSLPFSRSVNTNIWRFTPPFINGRYATAFISVYQSNLYCPCFGNLYERCVFLKVCIYHSMPIFIIYIKVLLSLIYSWSPSYPGEIEKNELELLDSQLIMFKVLARVNYLSAISSSCNRKCQSVIH